MCEHNDGWVSDRILDWLHKEGDIRVKELQKRLHDRWNMNVPYNRVFRGKEAAPEQIHGKWDDSYMMPPLLKRPPERPRKIKIKRRNELTRKRQRYKQCDNLGHQTRTYKENISSNPEPQQSTRRGRGRGRGTRGGVFEAGLVEPTATLDASQLSIRRIGRGRGRGSGASASAGTTIGSTASAENATI